MEIKFCGIRRPEDIAAINQYCPDDIGFIFAESRRKVTPEQADALQSGLQVPVKRVGVFVNASIDTILQTAKTANLQVIQLHGEESAEQIRQLRERWRGEIWKAVRVRTVEDIEKADTLPVEKLLLDAFSKKAYGGTGETADFKLIAQHRPQKPFFLAGGLQAQNIVQAIQITCPQGVDISSGIETNGCKDAAKMREILALLRGVS